MVRKFLKRFISENTVRKIEGFRDQFKTSIIPFFSKSSFLSSVYFNLFSGAFKREYRAVMSGMANYQKESQTEQQTQYKLRRNTHRIEKGLLMRPMKNVFARDFIYETVQVYQAALQNGQLSDPCELEWSHDVLTEYFHKVGSDPEVDKARALFKTIQPALDQEVEQKIPYSLGEKKQYVDYEEFLKLANSRKSVRWFLKKPVPRESLDKAVELASKAPSACNRQAFEYFIIDDQDLAQKVVKIPGGARGVEENIPVVVAVVGKLRAYQQEYDRHIIYIDGSLSAMSFILALETLGLSSCVINWPDKASNDNQATRLLSLLPDERVIMLIAVGYGDPEGKVAFSQRKSLPLMRRYISNHLAKAD
jgi:nitroreductase